MKKLLFWWLVMVCVVTFVCFACYSTIQQFNRQLANEPQVQIAEDTAAALGAGTPAGSLVQGTKVDMSRSLAPFIVIVDQNKNVIASTAETKGSVPALPKGFLDAVTLWGDHRLTWETPDGLRFATVTVRYDGAGPGYVVAARSLRETEARIGRIGLMILVGWVVGVVGFFFILLILRAIFGFWKKDIASPR